MTNTAVRINIYQPDRTRPSARITPTSTTQAVLDVQATTDAGLLWEVVADDYTLPPRQDYRPVTSQINNNTWDILDEATGKIIPWMTDLHGALYEARRLRMRAWELGA